MMNHPHSKWIKWLRLFGLSSLAIFSLDFSPPADFAPIEKMTLANNHTVRTPNSTFSLTDSMRLDELYDNLDLDSLGLSSQAFHKAIDGYIDLVATGEVAHPGILSIIDFTLPSSQKRLFILDMLNGRLLFNTLVAHGKNSGRLVASHFSNRKNSHMSSLGFYLTGEAFIGQHGYSLRLDGVEKGFNDNVYRRSIIMHPANYVSEDYIRQWGYLGRSEGCPAIPQELDQPIIDSIRGGSCMFVYGKDKKYLKRSRLAS
ncbi:MAG TPA: murein L,D-transpeptidase catalytic domain family protein [Puia sp.]|jgi:hypothetical protein